MKGKLYLVPTPIGNLDDITLRAIQILKMVDLICAEDTRDSGILLKYLKIKTPMTSLHDFNEVTKMKTIIKELKDGKNVALISDRGTPLISDPGYKLVKALADQNFDIIPLPGATAGVTALIASGLPTNNFIFLGFLNSKETKAKLELEQVNRMPMTIIIYEAPHRLIKTLKLIKNVLGDREIAIARELTKINEEFLRGKISVIIKLEPVLKGEMVILIEGAKETEIDLEQITEEANRLFKAGNRKTDIIKQLTLKYGIKRNQIYDLIHKME